MKYHFKIHREGKGFWAECIELKGCVTQAKSKKALQHNMEEALNLYLDEPYDSKTVFPSPQKPLRGKNIIAVPVDPKIAFSFLLRQTRLHLGLTQKEAAQRLGFKNIYSYQRLESARTANPEFATIVQIKRAFPGFDLEEVLAA